jgi:transposase
LSGSSESESRHQSVLFPESLDDYITEDSAVHVINVFIDDLDISGLGFKTELQWSRRPGYRLRMVLKPYVWGHYLNRVQSSRRLEREAQRNVELMWLTERLEDTIVAISVPGC